MTNAAPVLSPLRRAFLEEIREGPLQRHFRPGRHENGDRLRVEVFGVWPKARARASLILERFIGGGFAGQVYEATVEALDGEIAGLAPGRTVAVKIQRPPSRFAMGFRDTLYRIAYQGDFAAQVNPAAVMAGALWQKLLRRGAALEFGAEDAIVDVHAIFFDKELCSWAEISEWVPGRTWLLEVDEQLHRRFSLHPELWLQFQDDVPSPEYHNKRAFMARLVRLFHAMGAWELARQYEWWSLKSQPNALKRRDGGPEPSEGLVAIDFRAGLALLPFLPMSPVDVPLILRGIRRGDWVQFDRGSLDRLDAFVAEHAAHFEDMLPALAELREHEAAYRSSLPDLAHHGARIFTSPSLRCSIRDGFIQAWHAKGIADVDHVRRLRRLTPSFLLFLLLGLVPLLGGFVRRLQGDAAWRAHVARLLTDSTYLRLAFRARMLNRLVLWHREARVDDETAEALAARSWRFWAERLTIGWLPAGLHVLAREPTLIFRRAWSWTRFAWDLATKESARVDWLLEQVEAARRDGSMNEEEERRILASIQDPFIQTYLKSVAVHVCTVPVTQVTSVLIALYFYLFVAADWQQGLAMAGGVLAAFQATPISPGSLARAAYVLYRMIRDRNFKDYWIALALSMWHYIGYVSFPVQMVARFPGLAVFLGGSWATRAARVIPVFGEKGALLEHLVFDAVFNLPLTAKALISRKRVGAGGARAG